MEGGVCATKLLISDVANARLKGTIKVGYKLSFLFII